AVHTLSRVALIVRTNAMSAYRQTGGRIEQGRTSPYDPKQSLNVAAHCSAVGSGFLKRTRDNLQKRARIKPRVARDCDSLRPRFSQRIKLGNQGRHEVTMSN